VSGGFLLDMVDNPAEYFSKLESDLRASRAALRSAQDRVEELELALAYSDSIRASLVEAASDVSKNLDVALERLEQYQEVVDAAVEYFETDGRADSHGLLMRAVEPEIARREARS